MIVLTHSHRVYRRRRQRIRRLLLFLLTVLALYYFINSGYFSLDKIVFSGNGHIPTSELESIAGVEIGTNLWQVDTRSVEEHLATHPLVAASRVERHWPRTLVIKIEERNPAAILVQDGGFFLVDGSGVVMERVPKIGHLNLPLISGIKNIENVGPGKEIDDPALKAALEVVQQISVKDLNRLREIKALSPTSLQLIWEGNILIKFGDKENATAKLDRLQEALQGLIAGVPVEYIDVSYEGPPVVKFR